MNTNKSVPILYKQLSLNTVAAKNVTLQFLSSLLVFPAGGVCVLCVSWRAVPLAPSQPGAGTAALQRGAALGRHRDPAVSVAAKEDPAAPQVHQDFSSVSPDRIQCLYTFYECFK